MQIVFETPRLILRRFAEKDFGLIRSLNSDPEVVKYLHEAVLTTDEQAKNILTNIILPQYKNNLGRWAMYTRSGNEFIGWCGLKSIPERDEIDLGYRLKLSSWGKDYATEAARKTIDYGLKQLKISLITGRAHIENIASIRVLEKIGMKFSREEIVDDVQVRTYTISS